MLGAARLLLTVEEHGQGKQMLRFRITPHFRPRRTWVIGAFIALTILSALDGAWLASIFMAGISIWLIRRVIKKCAFAKVAILDALETIDGHKC